MTPSMLGSVLVVDDEEDMRAMVAFELGAEGYDVVTAANGLEAVAAFDTHRFDLVVTDLNMPQMNGVETLRALKELNPDVQVVVATGYASVDTAIACLQSGAYDYIRKPYEMVELRAVLERALEKSRLEGMVALHEVSRSLIGTLEPRALTDSMVGKAAEALRVDAVAFIFPDGRTVRSESGGPSEATTRAMAVTTGLVDESRELSAAEIDALASAEDVGRFAQALVFELRIRNGVAGTLMLFRAVKRRRFSSSDRHRCALFAAEFTLALENARLFDALEQKMKELIGAREALVRTAKLAIAGNLAAGLAHEINNPLGALNANASYLTDLVRRLAGDAAIASSRPVVDEMSETILDVRASVTRLISLLRGFDQVANLAPAREPEDVDVAKLVADLRETISLCNRRIDVGAAGQVTARIAPNDLRDALSYLIDYLDAAANPAPIAIEVACDDQGRPCVLVSDVSFRLEPGAIDRIFDPQLMARASNGVRMMRLQVGVTLAAGLLARSGATMAAQPLPGGGLAFVITLPAPER